MAIGDAFGVFMGTAATNRQPASGVVEQVSAVVKSAATDAIDLYDGSNTVSMITGGAVTVNKHGDAEALLWNAYNLAVNINNSVYLRKPGSTDRSWAGGVQIDA